MLLYQDIGCSRKQLSSTLCFTKKLFGPDGFLLMQKQERIGNLAQLHGKAAAHSAVRGDAAMPSSPAPAAVLASHPNRSQVSHARRKTFPSKASPLCCNYIAWTPKKGSYFTAPSGQKGCHCQNFHTTKLAKKNKSPFIPFILSHLFHKTFFPLQLNICLSRKVLSATHLS